jgi:WD40 repeat protein
MISCYDECKNHVIAGLNDGSLVWYDLEHDQVVDKRPHLHSIAINKLFLKDQSIYSASRDGVVICTNVMDPSTSEVIFDWRRYAWEQADFWGSKSRYSIYWLRNKHERVFTGLRPCRGTSRLMLPGYSGTCFIVDYKTKACEVLCHIDKERDMLGKAHYDTVFDCDYDPCDQLIATCGGAGHAAVLLWDSENYRFVGHLPEPNRETRLSSYNVRGFPGEILANIV